MSEPEIIAEGLQFPEGPIAMPDGSVILVEIQRKTLTRVWKGRTEVIAQLEGGPNGAAFGPDGAIYITNNGGLSFHRTKGYNVPVGVPSDYETGRIERVDLATGKIERIYDRIGLHKLSGPTILYSIAPAAFGLPISEKVALAHAIAGGLYYAKPDGSLLIEAAYGFVGLNGVGLSPDETVVYAAETETGKLWAFDIEGEGRLAPGRMGTPGRVVAVQPAHVYFDSLAVQANGDVCVATILNGGITTITPDGVSTHTPLPDPMVTNICFGGADMRDAFVTLSGTDRLVKLRWPQPGLRLNFSPSG